MKPPEHNNRVLTWVRDEDDFEYWVIDTYSKHTDWWEANFDGNTVLYWQELPPNPKIEDI